MICRVSRTSRKSRITTKIGDRTSHFSKNALIYICISLHQKLAFLRKKYIFLYYKWCFLVKKSIFPTKYLHFPKNYCTFALYFDYVCSRRSPDSRPTVDRRQTVSRPTKNRRQADNNVYSLRTTRIHVQSERKTMIINYIKFVPL